MRGLESEQEWLAADVPYLDILGTTILSRQQANLMAHAVGKLQEYQGDGSLQNMKLNFMGKQVTLPNEMIAIFPALHGYSTAKRQLIARGRKPKQAERYAGRPGDYAPLDRNLSRAAGRDHHLG